jgi:hypothetical protein
MSVEPASGERHQHLAMPLSLIAHLQSSNLIAKGLQIV